MASDPRALGGSSNHKFSNWARTYTCQAEAYFEPKTTEEIQQILSCAQQRGKRVKVVGRGHSPSDLACTTDYMISLKRYNRLIKVDKKKCQVTVEGGMLLSDLIQSVLVPNGMALSVQGSIADLSIAGTVSTGTHGSGQNYGIISSYVVSLQLMLASGEILTISAEENADLFPAARCSLGSLGVILNMTLQCEPAYKLHQKTYPAKLDDVLENLEVHVSASDHFRFLWIPHTDHVVVSHVSRTDKDKCNKSSWFWDYGIGYYLLELCLWISTFFPRLVATINRLFFKHLYSQVREKVDRSDVVFSFECLFKQYVMEWAIPRKSTAWVLKELQSWIERTGFPAHLPVEVRFVKQDEIYLSPAYGQESCYINIVMYRPYGKLVTTTDYWDEFEKIVTKVGGRPHWAKDHKVGPDQFRQLYPHWDTFCHIRKRLDPNGRFLNNYLERVFGTNRPPYTRDNLHNSGTA